jgi:hypothetical protein
MHTSREKEENPVALTAANIKKREFIVQVKDADTPGPDSLTIKVEATDGIKTWVGSRTIAWDDDAPTRQENIDAAEAEMLGEFT